MAVTSTLLLSVLSFALLSCFLFIYHEMNSSKVSSAISQASFQGLSHKSSVLGQRQQKSIGIGKPKIKFLKGNNSSVDILDIPEIVDRDSEGVLLNDDATNGQARENETDAHHIFEKHEEEKERKGELICNGKPTDSEIIYWKHVPGDDTYESPITPHHG